MEMGKFFYCQILLVTIMNMILKSYKRPLYTCHWYSQDGRCEAFGDQSVGEGGFTANQACCSCGGGNKPTSTPSSSPTVSCNNLLSTWHDPGKFFIYRVLIINITSMFSDNFKRR